MIPVRNASAKLIQLLGLRSGAACLLLERRTWQQGQLATELTIIYVSVLHWCKGRFSPTLRP